MSCCHGYRDAEGKRSGVSAFTARASSIDEPMSHINVEQTYYKQCEQLDSSSMLVQILFFEILSANLISMISESLNNFNRPLRSNS